MPNLDDNSPLGLIAGEGHLPLLVARGAAAAGRSVACVGLREQYHDDLEGLCDTFATAGIIQIGRWIRLLKKQGVKQCIMVGRVKKVRMYDPLYLVKQIPDWRAARIWFVRLRHDKRNDAILGAVADELAKEGITLIDSTEYIATEMADPGVMTTASPTAEQEADIQFALPIVERMGDLDVGQSIAVKDREIVAVEAIEGTDKMIKRAGELCRRGSWTLLKIAKPNQDMRFDVPTVGLGTIQNLKASGGACLAVETGKVIMVDKADVIAEAEKLGVTIIGIKVGE